MARDNICRVTAQIRISPPSSDDGLIKASGVALWLLRGFPSCQSELVSTRLKFGTFSALELRTVAGSRFLGLARDFADAEETVDASAAEQVAGAIKGETSACRLGGRNRPVVQVVQAARPLARRRDYGSGVLPNDLLPDLPSPDNPSGKLVLLRHGETEWSKEGRHTGLTDIPLTARGEELARGAGRLVVGYDFSLVLTSPLQRAQRTAELAGLHAEVDPLLIEWDYGGYEGRTSRDIRSELGYNWSAFTHGVIRGQTPGETVEEVAARASRVLTRVLPAMAEGDVALVAHGHFLRILTAVYLRMAPRFGAQITLDAGSVSVLSFYREQPAILSWNYGLELPLVPSES